MADFFYLKQFKLKHEKSGMKVGTDALLLGSWAKATEPKYILDVGTGCGLIAMMLAQRFENAQITGIDLEEDSVLEATENFSNSVFASRLAAVQNSYQQYEAESAFDFLVCNPPFFSNSLPSPEKKRNHARHLVAFDPKGFFKKMIALSHSETSLAMIIPVEGEVHWMNAATEEGWEFVRKTWVSHHEGMPFKRLLVQFCRDKKETEENNIWLYEGQQVSRHYYTLLSDFMPGI